MTSSPPFSLLLFITPPIRRLITGFISSSELLQQRLSSHSQANPNASQLQLQILN